VKGNTKMATKGNSNRAQKNGVRFALATAATMMTLLGAQSLAFAGKSTGSAQAAETTVTIVPTTDTQAQLTLASSTAIPTENKVVSAIEASSPTAVVTATPTTVQATQITVATAQPTPRSHASR
jgi:hypothetical protein